MLIHRILVVLLLSLTWVRSIHAQAADPTLATIKASYQHIKQNLKSYRTASIDIEDESTEGGTGRAYYEGNKVKLIEITRFGETGKSCIQYYFDQGQLFFALETNYQYNLPIYWDKKQRKKMAPPKYST